MSRWIDPAHKLYGHLDRLALVTDGMVAPPVNVEIDLTNRCSLGCGFCHFAYTHTRGPLAGKRQKPDGAISGGDVMETKLWVRLLPELADYGVRSITWTGGGEPTLHPDFDEIIMSVPMDQGIYTHGGHIDPIRAARMKENMSWCYVSLDAHDRESFKAYKGIDRFEACCAGVRNLAQAKGKATVGVGFLLRENNWQFVEPMVLLAKCMGADYCQFRPTVLYEQNAPGKLVEQTAWLELAIERLVNDIIGDPFVEVDIGRFLDYKDWNGHGYDTCWWSGLSTVITPNGKVWECVNKREHPESELGDLTQESFAEIWERHRPCAVNESCRVMCRGHVVNETVDQLVQIRPHANFI